MIDIHCHILPGLDDGPASVDVSLEMAETAISEGITHVVATPHAASAFPFRPELVDTRREELQARLGGRLRLIPGCDFHLSFENVQDAHANPTRYTIGHKNYLLVEFADFAIPPAMDQVLHELQLAGFRPIVTHPERNPLIRSQPERLFQWLRQGCYAQVTAQSFLGRFGQRAREAAQTWLAENGVHFVASDAHNSTSRPLRLREAYDWVRERSGSEVAEALFRQNPLAAVEGRPLPYVPELADDHGQAPGATSVRRRKRFWFF
jgi:protein-tyrosine phosphatase